ELPKTNPRDLEPGRLPHGAGGVLLDDLADVLRAAAVELPPEFRLLPGGHAADVPPAAEDQEQDHAQEEEQDGAPLRLGLDALDQAAHAVGQDVGLQLLAVFRLHAACAPIRDRTALRLPTGHDGSG